MLLGGNHPWAEITEGPRAPAGHVHLGAEPGIEGTYTLVPSFSLTSSSGALKSPVLRGPWELGSNLWLTKQQVLITLLTYAYIRGRPYSLCMF